MPVSWIFWNSDQWMLQINFHGNYEIISLKKTLTWWIEKRNPAPYYWGFFHSYPMPIKIPSHTLERLILCESHTPTIPLSPATMRKGCARPTASRDVKIKACLTGISSNLLNIRILYTVFGSCDCSEDLLGQMYANLEFISQTFSGICCHSI